MSIRKQDLPLHAMSTVEMCFKHMELGCTKCTDKAPAPSKEKKAGSRSAPTESKRSQRGAKGGRGPGRPRDVRDKSDTRSQSSQETKDAKEFDVVGSPHPSSGGFERGYGYSSFDSKGLRMSQLRGLKGDRFVTSESGIPPLPRVPTQPASVATADALVRLKEAGCSETDALLVKQGMPMPTTAQWKSTSVYTFKNTYGSWRAKDRAFWAAYHRVTKSLKEKKIQFPAVTMEEFGRFAAGMGTMTGLLARLKRGLTAPHPPTIDVDFKLAKVALTRFDVDKDKLLSLVGGGIDHAIVEEDITVQEHARFGMPHLGPTPRDRLCGAHLSDDPTARLDALPLFRELWEEAGKYDDYRGFVGYLMRRPEISTLLCVPKCEVYDVEKSTEKTRPYYIMCKSLSMLFAVPMYAIMRTIRCSVFTGKGGCAFKMNWARGGAQALVEHVAENGQSYGYLSYCDDGIIWLTLKDKKGVSHVYAIDGDYSHEDMSLGSAWTKSHLFMASQLLKDGQGESVLDKRWGNVLGAAVTLAYQHRFMIDGPLQAFKKRGLASGTSWTTLLDQFAAAQGQALVLPLLSKVSGSTHELKEHPRVLEDVFKRLQSGLREELGLLISTDAGWKEVATKEDGSLHYTGQFPVFLGVTPTIDQRQWLPLVDRVKLLHSMLNPTHEPDEAYRDEHRMARAMGYAMVGFHYPEIYCTAREVYEACRLSNRTPVAVSVPMSGLEDIDWSAELPHKLVPLVYSDHEKYDNGLPRVVRALPLAAAALYRSFWTDEQLDETAVDEPTAMADPLQLLELATDVEIPTRDHGKPGVHTLPVAALAAKTGSTTAATTAKINAELEAKSDSEYRKGAWADWTDAESLVKVEVEHKHQAVKPPPSAKHPLTTPKDPAVVAAHKQRHLDNKKLWAEALARRRAAFAYSVLSKKDKLRVHLEALDPETREVVERDLAHWTDIERDEFVKYHEDRLERERKEASGEADEERIYEYEQQLMSRDAEAWLEHYEERALARSERIVTRLRTKKDGRAGADYIS